MNERQRGSSDVNSDRAIRGAQALKIILGTLGGLSIVAVIQLMSLDTIDLPLTTSLYAFAVAIPSTGAIIFATQMAGVIISTKVDPSEPMRFLGFIFAVCACIAPLIGMAGIFWHFSRIIAVVFIGFSLLALVWIILLAIASVKTRA
jgi:hypothetical protein